MEKTEDNPRKKALAEAKNKAIKNCRLLYSDKNKPATESLMRFGWECPESWNFILRDLSYSLEELNIRYYGKYRTKIVAFQVKEKFGSLRFYYDVCVDPPSVIQCWSRFAEKIARFLNCKQEFRYRKVIDVPRHTEHSVEEISKETYDAKSEQTGLSNVGFSAENGHYFKITHFDVCAKTRIVPTRRRLQHKLMRMADAISRFLDARSWWPKSVEQDVVVNAMRIEAGRMISDAEDKTEHICCICGTDIGRYPGNPVCETSRWISYVCKRCADKSGGVYIMNGKTYQNGKELIGEEKANGGMP